MNETTPTADGPADDRIAPLFDALRTRERRRIVTELLDADPAATGPVPVSAVAPATDVESARIQLYHVHLPRLVAADHVEWDREQDLLRAGEAYDELAAFVELLRTNSECLPDDWW